MQAANDTLLADIDRDGFVLVHDVVSPADIVALLAELDSALSVDADANPVRSAGGSIYAARNLLDLWPGAARLGERPPLPSIMGAILGPGCGLVRALFFDKPPDRTWALPWHKDQTIAVRDNRRPGNAFTKPTSKAGVPHVEAPVTVLEKMLTARIHLDDATEENGPLRVLPRSHTTGKDLRCGEFIPHTVLASAGDVLLMRPLLTHASNCSHAGTRRHRRIVHLEFAAAGELPDGHQWHAFRTAPRDDGARHKRITANGRG